MEKILDQHSQIDTSPYISHFIELWYPVIEFIANNESLFHHSYLKEVLLLRGLLHIFPFETFHLFKHKAKHFYIITR